MEKNVVPFLKWAGGKRQLLPEIRKCIPSGFTNYAEPFLGGGAVLFDLRPGKALVNDINAELINVYETIRDNVEELIEDLKRHTNDAEYFYEIRNLDRNPVYKNLAGVQRASRIIYLNRTCFNGLFRVNSRGQFNVPFGKYKNPAIVNEVALRAVSRYLNSAEIFFFNEDFDVFVKRIRPGTFVYLDPPYHPVSKTSSFTGYSLNGFGENDQIRLKKACDVLVDIGCLVLLSNSYCDFITRLYNGKKYAIDRIKAVRAINSMGSKRGEVAEALIRSY